MAETYTKYKDPWSSTDLVSAEAFNYIETQWDIAKSNSDAHNHDSRYYTKTEEDANLFSETFYTGFDADTLDGNHYTDIVADTLPPGIILMWPNQPIPDGWQLCDGTNGTPNLVDRFIIGAGDTYDPGDDIDRSVYNEVIQLEGTVTVGDHQLTIDEMPDHTHSALDSYASSNINSIRSGSTPNYTKLVNVTTTTDAMASGDGTHNHTTDSSITLNTIDSRPPGYALYYIIKMGF